MCLKFLPSSQDQPDARYNGDTVPWQRVINSKGEISNRQVSLAIVGYASSDCIADRALSEASMAQLARKPHCKQKEWKLAVET